MKILNGRILQIFGGSGKRQSEICNTIVTRPPFDCNGDAAFCAGLTITHIIKMQISKTTTKLALFAGATALAALAPQAQAQSSDALIDKLIDKGILTVNEAKDLRAETDKDFKTAFAAKTGMPDWVNGYKLSGDFRGRYEFFPVTTPPWLTGRGCVTGCALAWR